MMRGSVVGYRFYDKEMQAREAYGEHSKESKVTKSSDDVFDAILIREQIPDVGFIVCVRDPRAVLTSSVDGRSGFRVDWDLCYHNRGNPTIGLLGFDKAIRNMDDYFLCRYEDLVSDPMRMQEEIGQYFELSYDGWFKDFHMHDIPEPLRVRLNGVRPVSTDKINQWRERPVRIYDQFSQCHELFDLLEYWDYKTEMGWFSEIANQDMKRFDFLDEIIKHHNFKIGAEVGTGTGKTAMELLQRNSKLHLIQVAYYPGPDILPGDDITYCTCQKARRLWWRRVKHHVHDKRVTVLEGKSQQVVRQVKDGSLDFVFIDADHSYKECLQDIRLWFLKVRRGGLVCGHDFGHKKFPGVEQAVREYFKDDFKLTIDNVWYVWKTI